MGMSRMNCVFLLGMIVLGSPYIAWHFYYKRNTPPLIITTRNRSALPHETPFPAITICNLNKVKISLHRSLSREDVSTAELKRFFIFDNCNEKLPVFVRKETREQASQWERYYDFQKEASQSCSDMIVSCKWSSELVDCKKWFKPVLTNRGLCCGFNIAHEVIDSGKGKATEDSVDHIYIDWTPQTGFKNYYPPDGVPRRLVSGFSRGLNLTLNVSHDEYFCSKNDTVGFEIMMHSPLEIPPFDKYNTMPAYPGVTTYVKIEPDILEVNRRIAELLDPNERNCYFLDERKLRFYRVYTERNCELDCLANYTIEFCGCLPKHIPVDFSVKICGEYENKCVSNISTDYYKDICKCHRGCFEVNYGAKASMAYFRKNTPIYEKQNLAILDVYYDDLFYPRTTVRPNEKFIQWANYASISGSIVIGIAILKAVHFFILCGI